MEGNLPGKLLQEVITAPRETGYNPYDQLEGYNCQRCAVQGFGH